MGAWPPPRDEEERSRTTARLTPSLRMALHHRLFLRVLRAVKGFWHDDCIDRASLLAYTTLLALVPLVAVVFSVWNLIGFTVLRRQVIDHVVFQSLVPQVGVALIHYIDVIATRGATLGWFGVGGLLITALLLLHAVERHFNAIWHEESHCWWCRILRYLVLLILVPLGVAILVLLLGPVEHFIAHLGSVPGVLVESHGAVALFIEFLLFVLVYRVLPAAKVRMADAAAGAVVGVMLLTLSKGLLTLYFEYSFTETLYGALGLLPVFLLWLYLTWLSVLFGAEMAAARQVRPDRARHRAK